MTKLQVNTDSDLDSCRKEVVTFFRDNAEKLPKDITEVGIKHLSTGEIEFTIAITSSDGKVHPKRKMR